MYLERYREDQEWWNLGYPERYNTFETYLPANRCRILDVGLGPGFFLAHGKWRTLEKNLAEAGMICIKRGLYQALAQEGIGREALLFAVNPPCDRGSRDT